MIHQARLINNNSVLHIVKGNEEYEQQVQKLSHLGWQIAYTALWNGEQFSTLEKEKALAFISSFIKEQKNPKQAYSEFVQRVLLARQYIITHPGSYAPIPTEWFAATNTKGFSGTRRWYDSLTSMRQSLPLYKLPLQAFGEAVFETVESGSPRGFHFWRGYFGEKNQQGLMNLFLSVVANCKHD